jgi:dihydrofolate reductase
MTENIFSLEMIVACTTTGIIGNNNKIPWYIPEDLQHFKTITENGIVVMGRKTFESLPNGKLKNRINVVITRSFFSVEKNSLYEDVIFANENTIDSILYTIWKNTNKSIFIIGGSEIYNLFFDRCDIFHFTFVLDDNIKGDVILPEKIMNINNDDIKYKKVEETGIMFSKRDKIPFKYITYMKK